MATDLTKCFESPVLHRLIFLRAEERGPKDPEPESSENKTPDGGQVTRKIPGPKAPVARKLFCKPQAFA